MSELEGSEESLAFASGMGAIASTVLALCSAGSHVVAQRQLYAGTLAFLQGPCVRLGIETTFVDVAAPGAFAEAVRPGQTMVVLAESPSNPLLELADLDELGAIAGPLSLLHHMHLAPPDLRPQAQVDVLKSDVGPVAGVFSESGRDDGRTVPWSDRPGGIPPQRVLSRQERDLPRPGIVPQQQ